MLTLQEMVHWDEMLQPYGALQQIACLGLEVVACERELVEVEARLALRWVAPPAPRCLVAALAEVTKKTHN